jgi:hypothetical protein
MADRPAAGLPPIRRARGFRLYDAGGRRYLDLYRDGALLGHRAAGALTAMKAGLSQGLAAGLPTAWEGRLVSALRRLVPSHTVVRLYSCPHRAEEAASRYLGVSPAAGAVLLRDPSRPGASGGPAALWRPFLDLPREADPILPVLPVTVCGAPAPVCFTRDVGLPGSDTLPGFLLAAAVRGLAAVVRTGEGSAVSLGDRAVEEAVDGAECWSRTGPYVWATCAAGRWASVHARFLDAGVLLNPGFPGPSVLPAELSPGESRLLAGLFAAIPGG